MGKNLAKNISFSSDFELLDSLFIPGVERLELIKAVKSLKKSINGNKRKEKKNF